MSCDCPQKNLPKKLKSAQKLTNEDLSNRISEFRKKNKIGAEEELCFAIGGVIHCDKFPTKKPKSKTRSISSIPWHIKFHKEQAEKFIGPRRRRQKSAQEETETLCVSIGAVIHCFDVPKNTPKPEIERIKRDLTRGEKRFRRSQKIAQLNLHTKLLSAKLKSIKIGKLLEAKKKQ